MYFIIYKLYLNEKERIVGEMTIWNGGQDGPQSSHEAAQEAGGTAGPPQDAPSGGL